MKIVTIVGARPQFIKASVISRAIDQWNASATDAILQEVIVHTGQHYDHLMSELFFQEMGIREPAVNLGVGSSSHAKQTAAMLVGIEDVLQEHQPDWTILYGDTNSTLAGAIAAAKLHLPIAHVEAGLRSFNMRMPEEVNRIVTDRLSTLLFCPTHLAVNNLAAEGMAGENVINVGDVMYDAALYYGNRPRSAGDVMNRLKIDGQPFVLGTVHRAENTDDPHRLREIIEGIKKVAATLPVVLPMHPRTVAVLKKNVSSNPLGSVKNLYVVEPVGYLEMVQLERAASVVLTDSGGMQKEAFFHGTPCVTLRDETEWVETVEMGWNRLVCPLTAHAIEASVKLALESSPSRGAQPYGDGNSGRQIVEHLIKNG